MSVKKQIEEFITNLQNTGKHSLFRYLYSKNSNEFDPLKDTVYYSGPYWDNSEAIAAIDTILTGKWLSTGENVHKFECAFSKKFDTKYSLMVNSGSSANLVMIAALKKYLKWKDGDEIIISVVGFPTTLNPIIQNNLTPVFVDINLEDLNWNIDEIEKKITTKTKAIFVSPVLGNPGDFGKIIELCKIHNIELILDDCDSLGTTWGGLYLSSYAVASTTSFYPSHHLTAGAGGMVSSDNEELIKIARSFATWGKKCFCSGSAALLPCGQCGNRFDTWLAYVCSSCWSTVLLDSPWSSCFSCFHI
jgi:CDP-6-deoxy-D-xylo-4-hexulose-3-dehydrase